MKQQLTVVLPMHNKERQIRSIVHDLLDLSVLIKIDFDLVIVDDGSNDDTFETACELARMYPRIKVLRQAFRSGLPSVLEMVRNRLQLEMVIVHDGVSAIEPSELRRLLVTEKGQEFSVSSGTMETVDSIDARGSRRFAAVRALHESMESAHRAVLGFAWLKLPKPLVPRRRQFMDHSQNSPVLGSLSTPTYLAELPLGMISPTIG